MSDKQKILEEKIAESKIGGGKKKTDSQHEKGKLTARERIELLLDDNSFEEIGALVMHRSSNFGLDKKKFLEIYFYGVIFGGLFFLVSYNIFPVFKNSFSPLIGSSAAVYSILLLNRTF